MLRRKNIVVGGGGLWGLDMNLNTFFLSVFLFVSRFIFRKKIYLLGVGYYNSTTRLGHFGAWLAGKSAKQIIVRDDESYANFSRISKATTQDQDIAFYIPTIDTAAYQAELSSLETVLPASQSTVFVALRRFRHRNNFNELVEKLITTNGKVQFIVALLELETVDQESAAFIEALKKKYKNVHAFTSPHNPLALYAYFEKYAERLAVIAPQFHIILTAHLATASFLPVVYDNKVEQLLTSIGIPKGQQIDIAALDQATLQQFVVKNYRG